MNSLLYKNNNACDKVNKNTIIDLSLDKTLQNICSDIEIRQEFIDIISCPLTSKNDIVYRQSILKDFLTFPSLLPELQNLLDRFVMLKKDYDKSRREGARSNRDVLSNDDTHKRQNLLKVSALNLKRTLLLIKSLSDLLCHYDVLSEGVQNFKLSLDKICTPSEYGELLQICSYLTNISITDPIDIKISIGSNGKINKADLISHKYIRITDPSLKEKKILFKKKETVVYPCTQIDLKTPVNEKILSVPFQALCSILDDISNQIFDKFSHYKKDCRFYQMAIEYYNFLTNKGYSLTFPDISDTKRTELISLYDLYLVTREGYTNIIPNDFSLTETQNGAAIFGKNSGGKTVFLRSIGTTQLFAQAGLPIPARSSTIYPYKNIVTLFAKEETANTVKEDAGRFEQEVVKIAEIIENNTNNSLILLNEAFQSTSYEEGAEGLANILDYLTFRYNKWILVSHISQIKEFFNDKVSVLNVSGNYKIN